ncbi:hypothetical protein GCM10011390_03820 [Aureimonas endophytica]|uniref:DUF983 domain-containing protein n=1 Tax=Aureimonas endophytica TaxID=2027858 RepID=A0A916ZCL7_9HYPH|nr:DUF983 domain-containing protein [Aureimonas endophytica]GGD88280.1 hypothetical protein GCM10011390_03820 [Aureimonas endophytica]
MTIETLDRTRTHAPVDTGAERPLVQAMLRGFLCRCPNCGQGPIFAGYLRTAPACSSCGQIFEGHRADDLPPYLTVFVVGHLVVALYMALEELVTLSMWTHLAIFLPLTIILTLALLRPMKGLTIGLQWAMRMHGFGNRDASADH